MVLVFILCAILVIVALLSFMLIFSTLHFSIKDYELSNIRIRDSKPHNKVSSNYQVVISLFLFNKIKWFCFKLNDKKMRKMYSKLKIDKVDLKKLKKEFKLTYLKEIGKIKPKIAYLKLEFKLDTEDTILTSFLVFAISTFISIILPYMMKKYQKDKYKYEIIPLYKNQNIYDIKFDCIIEVEMVHIINIIYVFLKKRRGDKNERTSNRRSYGYSYE